MKCKVEGCSREVDGIYYCWQHNITFFDTKNYSQDRFYLVHATEVKNLPKILKDGKLKPLGRKRDSEWTEYWGIDSRDVYRKQIFFGLLYPYNEERLNMHIINKGFRCNLIFDVKKMYEDGILNSDTYFCNEWAGGGNDETICMEGKETLKVMLNSWRKFDIESKRENQNSDYINEKGKLRDRRILSYLSPGFTSAYQTPYNEIALTLPRGLSLKYLKAIQYPLGSFIKKKAVEILELVETYKKYHWIDDLNNLDENKYVDWYTIDKDKKSYDGSEWEANLLAVFD